MMLPSLAALGAVPEEVETCLAQVDVPCAERAVAAAGGPRSADADVVHAAAVVHFHAGRFPEARDTLARARDLGASISDEQIGLYTRTTFATADWRVVDAAPFVLRYRPGPDAILVEQGLDVLRRSREAFVPMIGAQPPGVVALEIYPDVRSFIAASSFMEEDVHTTGVVALSKWSRLLVTSPRTHGTGYGWKDTVAHEYIHLLVSHASGDRAPVWLQEGIARALETRWADSSARFEVGARAEGLLARALRDDSFVPFEAMHPSLAKLPSPEAAALAYAQLGTLIDFCLGRGGSEVIARTLRQVRSGEDPRSALATAAGFGQFSALEAAWKDHLRKLGLQAVDAAEPPVVLEGGEDVETDPVLSEREDLARWLTLGDVLAGRGHAEAALVEYARAIPSEAEGPSPVLAARMAAAHRSLGHEDDALSLLHASARVWPEVAGTWTAIADVLSDKGDLQGAIDAWSRTLALDPFDVETREHLRAALLQAGRPTAAAPHGVALDVLVGRGRDDIGALLHGVRGTYELPRYAPRGGGLQGLRAPALQLTGLDGRDLELVAEDPIVIDFWATWCGPCRAAMPEIDRLAARYAGDGVQVLGVTEEPADVVEAFLARPTSPRVSYAMALDPRGDTRRRFGVSGLPTVVVVGRDGVVVDVIEGGGADATRRIEAAIEKALGGGG